MGLKARSKRKERRKQEKRARKAARQALYEEWTRQGRNKKSKRALAANRKFRQVADFSHPFGPCGNIGCDSCRGRTVCRRSGDRCKCGRHYGRVA